MIKTLYPSFQHWSAKGSVYLYSDPHFADEEMKYLRQGYIGDNEQVARINSLAHRNDTLIILGDIGDETRIADLKAGYKVLVTGNHDKGVKIYEPYFDEVYDGPIFISQKLVLSHEPLEDIGFAYNIHGHLHGPWFNAFGEPVGINCQSSYHFCVSAEYIDYTPVSLDTIIKSGVLNKIDSIHRMAIDNQIARKMEKIPID